MNITVGQLAAIIRYPQLPERFLMARCEKWLTPLQLAMDEFFITSPEQCAHFLAQVAHESGRLAYVREIWGPTKAQGRYEGRQDLGNLQPGDGFRFRGRGLIQITGRANYRAVAVALGLPLLLQPELLERPDVAARASAWWWHANGLNELADAGNVDHVSDRINRGRITTAVGDSNGYQERKMLTERALRVFGVAA